jgi:hypothetical protein
VERFNDENTSLIMFVCGFGVNYTLARTQSVRRLLRLAIAFAITAAALFAATTGALYLAMHQPPERFGAIMAKMPSVAMMILPFRPLWMSARAGHLQIGDQAPDFILPRLNADGAVRLSEQLGSKSVVLVFGSYT